MSFHNLENIKFLKTILLGYRIVYMPKHPYCNKSGGWVYYHRLVMENELGRYLNTDEQVHHIDENKLNNDPKNLMVCSSSEHSAQHHPVILKPIICLVCNKQFQPAKYNQIYCSMECSHITYRRTEWPTKEELSKLVWEMPSTKVGEKYGVSGKTIEKWCKKYKIEKPPRGYWQKMLILKN